MAVPILTTITPNEGHPGGKFIIEIVGTDFELPPSPPAIGYVGGLYPETMEVEIDGEEATNIKVWSDTLLTCLAPPYRGLPGSLNADPGLNVDVLLRNLTGPEEDTYSDVFSYRRTDLTRSDSVLRHVLRTVIRELRRQVIDNVVMGTTVDYDSDTGDALDIIEIADVPALALFAPSLVENKFHRTSERSSVQDIPNLRYDKFRVPRYENILFDVTLTANGLLEGVHLLQEFIDFFVRNKGIIVDKDTTNPSAGTETFELFMISDPTRTGSPNDESIFSFTASFEIRGVPIDSDDRVSVEWGYMLDDPPDIDVTYETKED